MSTSATAASTSPPRKIMLDCDPGHDDAVAIMLAHGSPKIELVALTTVAGNTTLENATRNAQSVATVIGLSGVPIAAGCARPLIRTLRVARDLHGDSGLEGPRIRPPSTALDPRHAVDLIIDTIMSHPAGEVTLVATAPLTNIALAVRKAPAIVERVREVVLMGGGFHAGNSTAVAEFNIITDPEAAHIVFNEPWPLTMVGLDLTHQALITPDVLSRVEQLDTTPARFVIELIDFFASTYRKSQGFEHPPIHDPCAVAYVIDPQVMSTRKAPIDVELSGALTAGMTVTDLRRAAPPDCHTQVAVTLDQAGFWQMVIGALKRIGEVDS